MRSTHGQAGHEVCKNACSYLIACEASEESTAVFLDCVQKDNRANERDHASETE